MTKFLSSHTLPAGAIGPEKINEMARAAQDDPVISPYRSFMSLSEGKCVCVMEAPDRDSLARWFERMEMPVDYITELELEGERGVVREAQEAVRK